MTGGNMYNFASLDKALVVGSDCDLTRTLAEATCVTMCGNNFVSQHNSAPAAVREVSGPTR